MASSGFPSRKSEGSGAQTSKSTAPLDGPPPSPAMSLAGGMGSPMGGSLQPGQPQPMPSFEQLAQPMTAGSPGRATSPEVVMGIMQSAETMYGMIDSMASIIPALATDFMLIKDQIQRTMGKLLVQGGQPSSPNSAGLNFPGGGYGGPQM